MIFLNGKEVDISQRFPDGTSALKLDPDLYAFEDARDRTNYYIGWRYESDAEMISLYYIVHHLRAHGAQHICLTMPYVPNARNDRVVNDEDVFTLQYFARFINQLGFEKVFIQDPHSHVAPALIDRVVVCIVQPYVRSAIQHITRQYQSEGLVIFYPDEGAMKRYHDQSPLPYSFGIKTRDWKTGKIDGLQLVGEDAVRGKDVLIVDDICSRGGTFLRSAKALREAGAKRIFLYVTHCENTIEQGDLLTSGLVEHVYTTTSIYTGRHEMITVMA